MLTSCLLPYQHKQCDRLSTNTDYKYKLDLTSLKC